MRARKLGPVAVLLAALSSSPLLAATPDWSPPWAERYPETISRGQVGVVVAMSQERSFFCSMDVAFMNGADQTIRSAHFTVEVFFGERSVVAHVSVQLADPARLRIARLMIPEACPEAPSRVVFREVSLCRVGEQFVARGCGLPFVAARPVASAPRTFVPVEFAPDFGR